MAAVSQALIDFANGQRPLAAPGVEIIRTDRYQITLQPDFPAPGPNSVTWVRCAPGQADALIHEVHAAIAGRGLPVMWIVGPETEPADLAERLMAHGVRPAPKDPEVKVMVLPVEAPLQAPRIAGLEIRDALADVTLFRQADAVAAEAFGSDLADDARGQIQALERRRLNQLAAGNRRVLLATVDGEPAGSAGLTLLPPGGAIINGGAVRPRFRSLGVYRALLATRLAIARRAGAAGLAVWGGDMSGPILARVGFVQVGWRHFYLDTTAI